MSPIETTFTPGIAGLSTIMHVRLTLPDGDTEALEVVLPPAFTQPEGSQVVVDDGFYGAWIVEVYDGAYVCVDSPFGQAA